MKLSDFALIAKVEKTIRLQRLIHPGDTLVVALSGGADSVALLDILSRLHGYDLRLIATHLNHCLRGAEADADQEFCRLLAARYGIPFEARRIDILKMAGDSRLNLEDAGRRARIDLFDEISTSYRASAVALAHHADDQAETVLMRMLRGSGMSGLSGMAYRNGRGYIRPLLDITRLEIEQYLRCCGIEWREDASNSDTAYLRNRIRHQLLPLLEEYNPAIRSGLAATAAVIRGDETLLREVTEEEFRKSCRVEEGRAVFSVAHLVGLNPSLNRRLLRRSVMHIAGTLDGIWQRHIESVVQLTVSERPHSQVALPHGMVALREYDVLALTRSPHFATATSDELLIDGPGQYRLPWGGSIAVELSSTTDIPEEAHTLLLDRSAAPFPWSIRTFHSGDRMVPLGMSGSKKVKNIFIDKKIPQSKRRRIPLLFCDNSLLWIAGVCCSELCRITTRSAVTVRVTWQSD
jgi:tRNA(Ile)-lysidine synthase